MKLQKGAKYDLSTMTFVGWDKPNDGTVEGYHAEDFFLDDLDGSMYLGMDCDGVEPLYDLR